MKSPLELQLQTQRALISARTSLARLKLNEIRWHKTRRRIAARTDFDYPRLDWMAIVLHLTPELAANVNHSHMVNIVVDEAA